MRHINPEASECLNAVRLTRDPARLHAAPVAELVNAAAACAKALVRVAEATGHVDERTSAFRVLDRAGRLIGRELRRREPNMDH
jgi:hypothetical protein